MESQNLYLFFIGIINNVYDDEVPYWLLSPFAVLCYFLVRPWDIDLAQKKT
jgi:hypothetical protein